MKTKFKKGLLCLSLSLGLLVACDDDDSNNTSNTQTSDSSQYVLSHYGKPQLCPEGVDWATDTEVQLLLQDISFVDDNTELTLPEGCFRLESEITFANRENIVIKGAGIDKTFLDFSQSESGEGISVSGSKNVVISNLQVSEAAKNAIKVTDTDGIIIRDVAAIWMEVPRKPDPDTGALRGTYALYPVSSRNIVIENTWSYGSADAGVYVGQSKNVIVRNNVAERNIAGIEIENTENADVYNNLAIGNTGGLLVFDLPGAALGNAGDPTSGDITRTVRLFNNIVRDNNLENYVREACRPDCGFAGGVHIVPPGTGVIVLAARDTEIFNNTITNHESMAIAVTSYLVAEDDTDKYEPGNGQEGDAIVFGWNPTPTNIYIHDNLIEQAGANPNGDLIADMILGYKATQGAFPNILYDGIGEVITRSAQYVDSVGGGSVAFKPIADALEASVVGSPLEGAGFWNYLWNIADNNVCIENNALDITIGSLYDGKNVADFLTDSEAFLANPAFIYGVESDLLSCSLTPQAASRAVIDDYEYSFARDGALVDN